MKRRAALLLALTAACGSSTTTLDAGAPTARPYRDLPDVPRRTVPVELPEQYAIPTTLARPSKQRATRGTPRTRPPANEGDTRTVVSTAYCLTGTMANGQSVHAGAVAMNGVPLGSRWEVVGTGRVYTVADRIGHGSQFDIAMPGDCDAARAYGRRTITIQRVA